MNKFKAFLALSAGLLLTTTALSEEKNLLGDNGSFETSKSGTWPDGIGKATYGQWLEENGNHFIRLETKQPGKLNMIFQRIYLPKNTNALKVFMKARVTDLVRGEQNWFDARIMIKLMSGTGEKLDQKTVAFNKNTNGWVTKEKTFIVPEETTYIDFMPCLFNTKAGNFDIDDLAIIPVDATPILAKITEEHKAKK